MEVMLEIYKTLGVLNMQWRRKDGISMPDIGTPIPSIGGYTEEVEAAIEQWTGETGAKVEMGRKAPAKKEAAAVEKAAQGLYLVETRARYGDIMVSSHLANFRNADLAGEDGSPALSGRLAELPRRLPEYRVLPSTRRRAGRRRDCPRGSERDGDWGCVGPIPLFGDGMSAHR